MRLIAACILALMLPACVSAEQQRAQAEAQAAAINANDDAKCQSFGAAPGSQAYIQCRMNLDNQRAAMRQMVAGALVNNMLQH
jgi:hypothetical protein